MALFASEIAFVSFVAVVHNLKPACGESRPRLLRLL
jgi:hypothetical protein